MPDNPTPRAPSAGQRLRRAGALLLAGVMVLSGCTGEDPQARPPVRVAAGEGSEQQVVAAVIAEALRTAGIDATVLVELGDTIDARDAVRTGRADVYVDYSGSAWTRSLGRSQPLARPADSFDAVQAADLANELLWFAPTTANATLALFVRAADRPPAEAGSLTWLAGRLATAEEGLCAHDDFLSRPSGLAALAENYAISTELLRTTPLEEGEALEAVAAGRCFAGLGTATAGLAVNLGLSPVIDDQQVFPAFVVSPVARARGRADAEDVRAALTPVMQAISSADLASMNAEVEAGADPAEVARTRVAGP